MERDEENQLLSEEVFFNENLRTHRNLFMSLPSRKVFCALSTVLYATIYLVYFVVSKDNKEFDVVEFLAMSSDLVIALSYFVIPFLLIYVVTLRKDVPFNYLFWMFSMFIVGCGVTHLFGMGYFAKFQMLGAIAKALTALISFATAAVLTLNIPVALLFPSPEQLRREIQQRVIAQKRLQSQYRKVVLHKEITHHLRQSVRPSDILETAVTQLGNSLSATRCTVHFDLDNLSKVQHEFLKGNITSVANLEPIRVSDSRILSKLASDQIRVRYLNYADAEGDSLHKIFREWSITSLIVINLSFLHQANKNGWIFIQQEDGNTWSREEIELAEGVAATITSCLTQAHLIELDKAREVAEKANEAKTQFLAMISHEVRTPLNGIFGMLSVLKNSHLEETEKECVRIISESSNSLLGLLNSVLDFAKIEAGKLEVENKSFNLRKCLHRVYMLGKNMIATKPEVQLVDRTLLDAIPEFVVGDKYRLQQILINLLSNASKFTLRGEISMKVQLMEPSDDKVVKLLFEVSDTGIGIPENRLHVLFKAFSQVDTSMTRKYGGSGLGLVISKRLCEAMNGEMWVKSVVGKGTTFFFTIIATIAESAEADSEEDEDPKQEVPSAELANTRILIAEDNNVNQMVAKRMLNQMGFTNLTIVGDGQQAYDSVMKQHREKQPFDIVLMDLHMPVVDGITSTMRIRSSIDSGARPYIIALTADIQEPIKHLCTDVGMNNFIGKPFKVKELKEALLAGIASLKQSRKKRNEK